MKKPAIRTVPLPIVKKEPSWLGIDSLRGRYKFGSGEGLVNGLVEPGQLVSIESSPSVLFKGERLFVKRDCASSFLIRNVFLGSVFTGMANTEPIIAEPFAVDFDGLTEIQEALFDGRVIQLKIDRKAVDLLGQPWPMPVCRPGIPILFCVENIGAKPSRFFGAFLGQSVA